MVRLMMRTRNVPPGFSLQVILESLRSYPVRPLTSVVTEAQLSHIASESLTAQGIMWEGQHQSIVKYALDREKDRAEEAFAYLLEVSEESLRRPLVGRPPTPSDSDVILAGMSWAVGRQAPRPTAPHAIRRSAAKFLNLTTDTSISRPSHFAVSRVRYAEARVVKRATLLYGVTAPYFLPILFQVAYDLAFLHRDRNAGQQIDEELLRRLSLVLRSFCYLLDGLNAFASRKAFAETPASKPVFAQAATG